MGNGIEICLAIILSVLYGCVRRHANLELSVFKIFPCSQSRYAQWLSSSSQTNPIWRDIAPSSPLGIRDDHIDPQPFIAIRTFSTI